MTSRYIAAVGLAATTALFTAEANAQTAPLPKPAPPPLARWFELQNATLNLRYRFIDTTAGAVTTNQLQHRETLRARVKFDKSARYTLNVGLFTGTRFTSGWDNTGWGINDAQKNLAFKTIYLAAIPFAGVEAQYGGLYIIKGESTELTTYDDDGYVIGQRVSVKRPARFFFDEISATLGYLAADPREIPISKRTKYLNDEPNYRHFLVDKKIGKRAGISADFTYAAGARTWREGLNLKTPELRLVDTIIFENYQRVNQKSDRGFALTLDKALNRKLSVNAGYASIDPNYGILNADRFHIGNRIFAMAIYNISPQFIASAFITRAVGNDVPLPQRTLSNIVFTYNALPDLKRTGLF
ncbi:MAG TPA: hypothetical protein VJM31_16570 [Vicinamibacterales bacterium]|nr:hypothetical protein [Vicinamibacterales bacterium]